MNICLITDAWFPQINGVVRTLNRTCDELRALGHTVTIIEPTQFRTMACPTYPDIRLSLTTPERIGKIIESHNPDSIHISTEGPLGMCARRYCIAKGHAFTTTFHTRFPEYIHARCKFPLAWSYAWMRRFHSKAVHVMAATDSLLEELRHRGFGNTKKWTRGVDTNLFRPRIKSVKQEDGPIMLYVGRVAVEKNIEAFLRLRDLPGKKVIVGDGPALQELKAKYPEADFVGSQTGEDLAMQFSNADVFVFPSKTDTFGLVMLEALASGVPVAAYPVQGPVDVITSGEVGCLDENLSIAINGAIGKSPDACRAFAKPYSWQACAMQFLNNLAPLDAKHTDTAEGVRKRA